MMQPRREAAAWIRPISESFTRIRIDLRREFGLVDPFFGHAFFATPVFYAKMFDNQADR